MLEDKKIIIALRCAIDYHCRNKIVPEYIAKHCQDHAEKLNNSLPTEMALCEIPRLILHKDQIYIFRQYDECVSCYDYLKGKL